VLAFLGLGVAGYGAAALLAGKTNYMNRWGGLVFAPFGLLFGVLLITFAIRY